MARVKSFLLKNPESLVTLENPSIGIAVKRRHVDSMFAKQKHTDSVKNLFQALADYGRLDHIGKVIGVFEEIMKAYHSEILVKVSSYQVNYIQ